MVRALERPVQALVNSAFRGKDPYQVLRTTTILVAALRLWRHLRRAVAKHGLRGYLVALVAPTLKRLPQVQRRLAAEAAKTAAGLRVTFERELTEPRLALPAEGLPEEQIMELLERREQLDTLHWQKGKTTGAVYHGGQGHYDFVGRVFAKWGFANPLHPAIHPALRQMDSEVVQMIINMYNGDGNCCGAFTTGGTESILMAMKAYRDWGLAEKGITEPNIIICNTAHAAFDKAGKYFNIHMKHARTNAEMEVDLAHVRRLIDGNTVAIVGSACQFAHGTVDPIQDMAKLALRRGIGLHVDCCLGGFLLPFMEKAGFQLPPCDFRVKGVTSISCDPHKYGFAPKGSSVVMFSSRKLRHHMYCFLTEWTGGIYATATMTGSRAGGPVAATWASMCKFGESGYVETTRQIVGATKRIAEGIRQISELKVVGRPDICVVAFTATESSGLNCYAIADCLKQEFNWDLQTCQHPPCVHLAMTLPVSANADQFVTDVREAVKMVKADTEKKFASTAGLYGMAASLPTSFLEEAAAAYIDTMNQALPGPVATKTAAASACTCTTGTCKCPGADSVPAP
mmetsp:Transcript_90759/g.256958  ORF Transcript_90759/g.256958 Transcript_90759/m.256958 type:complete len:571 (+) Transcript_90759:53-1765(+)